MAYTDIWNNSLPNGTEPANTIDDIFRAVKLDISERLNDIFGTMPNFATDPLRPYGLKFTDAQDAVISLGDNAGTPRALIIKDKTGVTTYFALSSTAFTVNAPINCTSILANSTITGTDIFSSAGNAFRFAGRSMLTSQADGNITLFNNTQTDFTALRFGGVTASFPALKRNGIGLEVRVADDSALSTFKSLQFISTDIASPSNGIDFTIHNGGTLVATFSATSGNSTFNTSVITTSTISSGASVVAAAGSAFVFSGRTQLTSPVDNNLLIRNNAGTDFGLLQFGGTTSSFPAIKRSTNGFLIRLADDSAYTFLACDSIVSNQVNLSGFAGQAKILGGTTGLVIRNNADSANLFVVDNSGNSSTAGTFVSGGSITIPAASVILWSGRSQITSPADSNLLLRNNAGTDFGLLQLGGTTSSFPALKRSTNALQVRLADDSAFASLLALDLTVTGGVASSANIQAGAAGLFFWAGRSSIQSPADGNILLTNNAGTGFTMLQLGGTTSSFPAIKRIGSNTIQFRRADDSIGNVTIGASSFTTDTNSNTLSDAFGLVINSANSIGFNGGANLTFGSGQLIVSHDMNIKRLFFNTLTTPTLTNGFMWFDGTNFRGVIGGVAKTFTLT